MYIAISVDVVVRSTKKNIIEKEKKDEEGKG